MPQGAGAFLVQGNTLLMACTTVASLPVQPSTAGTAGIQGLRLTNISTSDCYISIGVTTATAALPSTAASGSAFPLLQRTSLILSCPPNPFISGISTVASVIGMVALTPGYGVP